MQTHTYLPTYLPTHTHARTHAHTHTQTHTHTHRFGEAAKRGDADAMAEYAQRLSSGVGFKRSNEEEASRLFDWACMV